MNLRAFVIAALAAAWAASAAAAPLPERAGPPTQSLPQQRLLDAAAAALFAAHGGAIEARPLDDAEAELTLPAGTLRLQPRLPEGATLSRRMVVMVDVAVDAKHRRTVPVWFAVRAMRPVLVARAPLAAGQLPSETLFAAEPRDVAALPSPPWPLAQPLDGLQLRQPLPAGAVLTAAALVPRQAVARHQPVQVRVTTGAVMLTTSGVALSDARIGDIVRVMNPVSRESFPARVIADGLVAAGER